MKKFNSLTLVSTFLVLMLASSCGNNTELEKLRTELATLKTENASLKGMSKVESKNTPFESLSLAAEATRLFRAKAAGTTIVIPASWRFNKGDFEKEIDLNEVVYFRFYPSLSETILGDTLRLAMVPVDKNGQDLLGTEEAPRVYNFTMNCPDVCSTINVLNTDLKSAGKFVPTTFIKQ